MEVTGWRSRCRVVTGWPAVSDSASSAFSFSPVCGFQAARFFLPRRATLVSTTLSVELAKVTNPNDMPNADKDDAVIIGISASGDVYLGSTKSDISQIADQVRDRISNKLDKTVYVKSDGRAKYGDVVKIVDEIRSAGVDNVGLLTDKSDAARRTAPPPPAD